MPANNLRNWHHWRGIHLPVGMALSLVLLVAAARFPATRAHDNLERMDVRVGRQIERQMLPPIQTRHVDRSETPAERGSPNDSPRPPANTRGDAGSRAISHFESSLKKVLPREIAVSAPRSTPSAAEPIAYLRIFRWNNATDIPPELRFINIRYPRRAERAGIEGLVIALFRVDTDGRAYNVKLSKWLHPACDAEVIRAVRRARFTPARQDGRVIPALSHLVVRFRLDHRNAPSGMHR